MLLGFKWLTVGYLGLNLFNLGFSYKSFSINLIFTLIAWFIEDLVLDTFLIKQI
jgi:hypothetical protein